MWRWRISRADSSLWCRLCHQIRASHCLGDRLTVLGGIIIARSCRRGRWRRLLRSPDLPSLRYLRLLLRCLRILLLLLGLLLLSLDLVAFT